jgi:hypothetical protein
VKRQLPVQGPGGGKILKDGAEGRREKLKAAVFFREVEWWRKERLPRAPPSSSLSHQERT